MRACVASSGFPPCADEADCFIRPARRRSGSHRREGVIGPTVDGSPESGPPCSSTRRVLLAEDNLVNQRVAVGLLSRRGHHVTVVANGQEAVDAVVREQFDIVLMDLQMPVMGGLEATKAIRQRARDSSGERYALSR